MAWRFYGLLLTVALGVGLALYPGDQATSDQKLYVYDGDTLIVVTSGNRYRLADVDTPEIKDAKCRMEYKWAIDARDFLYRKIDQAKKRKVVKVGVDRYGRDLINLYLDGRDAAAMLIEAGYGRPYSGGKRHGWCE